MEIILFGSTSGFIGSALYKYLSSRHFVVRFLNEDEIAMLPKTIHYYFVNLRLYYNPIYSLSLKTYGDVEYKEFCAGFKGFIDFVGEEHISRQNFSSLFSIPEARKTLISTFRLLSNSLIYANNVNHLLISSRAVYGMPLYLPVDEDHTTKPKTYYGFLKVAQELMYRYFSNKYSLNYSILRVSDVYGPMNKESGHYLGTVSKFILSAKRNNEIILNGNGTFERDFIFVSDLCRVIVKIIGNFENNVGTINVGSYKGENVLYLAKTIAALMNRSDISISFNGIESNSFSFVLSGRKFVTFFGKTSFTTLSEGLKITAARSTC